MRAGRRLVWNSEIRASFVIRNWNVEFQHGPRTSACAIPGPVAVPFAAPQPTGGIGATNCKAVRKHAAGVWAARAKESWEPQFRIWPTTGPEAGPDKAVIGAVR